MKMYDTPLCPQHGRAFTSNVFGLAGRSEGQYYCWRCRAEEAEARVGCGVAVLFMREVDDGMLGMGGQGTREVLFHKRKGAHGAGSWSLVGGWMEKGESFDDAARREVLEETGMLLTGPVRVLDTISTVFPEGKHSVTVLVAASTWDGEPVAREPDKIEGVWTWFRYDRMPGPLFLPLAQSRVMASIRTGNFP